MFNPDLTEEKARERIGKIQEEKQWIFAPDSPLTTTCRRRHETGFFLLDWIDSWKEWQKLGIEEFLAEQQKRLQTTFDTFEPLLSPTAMISICVWEAVINAIEHGANYGREGQNATLQAFAGETGLLLNADDPGQGFDFERLKTSPPTKYYESFLLSRTSDDGQKIYEIKDKRRGSGLIVMKDKQQPEIWFERLRQGFRTRILFVAKRR